MFPEGTRSRTGDLLPFKKGAFIMAIQAQAPIVPVAIVGARRPCDSGSPFIWPTTIQVKLGAPVETAGMTLEDRDRVIDEVRAAMAACSRSFGRSGRPCSAVRANGNPRRSRRSRAGDQPPVENVSVHGTSGTPSLARMPSSSSTLTVRNRSSGLANRNSRTRVPSS